MRFKIEEDNVVERYGEDSSEYFDHFTTKLKQFIDKNKQLVYFVYH